MQKITKAVIPCGGMGTRFLPITKTLPKEMLPIIDTPVLSYIVEEAAASGISDVLIIINDKKRIYSAILRRIKNWKICWRRRARLHI